MVEKLANNKVIVPFAMEPFVEVLGVDLTIQLVLNFGGAGLYIPNSETRSKGALSMLVGPEMAIGLGRRVGAGEFKIPLCKPWVSRHLFYMKNLSIQEIARTARITEPSVRKYIRNLRERNEDQGKKNFLKKTKSEKKDNRQLELPI